MKLPDGTLLSDVWPRLLKKQMNCPAGCTGLQLQPQQLMCVYVPHQPAARSGARGGAATGWVLGQEQRPQQKRHIVAPKLCSTAYFTIEQVGLCSGVMLCVVQVAFSLACSGMGQVFRLRYLVCAQPRTQQLMALVPRSSPECRQRCMCMRSARDSRGAVPAHNHAGAWCLQAQQAVLLSLL